MTAPTRLNYSVEQLSSIVSAIISNNNLPVSGYCREWCVAILLLSNNSDEYSLTFADDATTEDGGQCLIGARSHFWLTSKSDENVIDPTAAQFSNNGLPLPYDYLDDESTKMLDTIPPFFIDASTEYVSRILNEV